MARPATAFRPHQKGAVGIRHRGRPRTELLLEHALRKAGVSFQANVQIDQYEVDFVVDPYVAVEVDGYMHVQRHVMQKDAGKTLQLRRNGYQVLRFTGDEVRYSPKACVKSIQGASSEQREHCTYGRPSAQLAPWQATLHETWRS